MKQDPSWNLKQREMLRRGLEGARTEHVDLTAAPAIVSKMLAVGKPPRDIWVRARFAAVAGVVAALAGVAFYPRLSSAASIKDVVRAAQQQSSCYEEVYKPDNKGKLYVYLKQWTKPGKEAEFFTNDEMEVRDNGKLVYCYWNSHGIRYQRVDVGDGRQSDPRDMDIFEQFKEQFKLLRVEDAGPHLKRYVFNIRQDLLVDSATNLPTQRVCYNGDGSVMEVHAYHFQQFDDRVFDPRLRAGVPFYNIPADRETLKTLVQQSPQIVVVGGIKVKLYAVIVDRNANVGAIVAGGDPRGTAKAPMEVEGLTPGWSFVPPEYTVLAPAANSLTVNGEPVRLDKITLTPETKIPDSFVLRIPIWRYDPAHPLIVQGKRMGLDSKIVGWAEFKVKHPLYTEQVEKILPNWVAPEGITGTGTANAGK